MRQVIYIGDQSREKKGKIGERERERERKGRMVVAKRLIVLGEVGTHGAGSFRYPRHVAIDPRGGLFVSDCHGIHRLTDDGDSLMTFSLSPPPPPPPFPLSSPA